MKIIFLEVRGTRSCIRVHVMGVLDLEMCQRLVWEAKICLGQLLFYIISNRETYFAQVCCSNERNDIFLMTC